MKASIKTSIIALFVTGASLSVSAQFNQRNTRDFINKTSYIIGEAYDIVYYYGYFSSGNLSKAVNHQNYAKYLYNMREYRYAIYHSDLARSYALRVIYNSTNYWDNYYRPYYYYSPPRPPYGYNRPPQNTYNYNYNYNYNYQGTQYGHRSGTSVSSVNRASNSQVSRYMSTGNGVKSVDFNTWDRNYYSSEEQSMLRGVSMPSERELESAIANTNNIRRVSDDKTVISNGIRNFSSDIDTYKRGNAEEARSISISRPSDFGTTPEVTRSTANTVSPITTRQQQTQPTETRQPTQSRQEQTQPTQTRQQPTQPVQQAQPTQTRQQPTQPVQQAQPTQTRQEQTQPVQQAQPTQTRQEQTQPVQQAQPTQTRQQAQPTQSTTQPSTRQSQENAQPASRSTTTTNQQSTPQRNSTPTTNQNTNNNTQRR